MKNFCGYKLTLSLIGFSILFFLGGYFFISRKDGSDDQVMILEEKVKIKKEDNETDQADIINNEQKIKKEEIERKIELPSKIRLKVPFTSQAPYAVWDKLHKEACEEASLLMAAYYYKKKMLDKKIAEEEILRMVDFQNEKYGGYKDSNMEQLKQLAEDYFEMKKGIIIEDPKQEELKEILAGGQPIIVPAAGRLLGNPFFTPPGPLYHNLMLIGYDDAKQVFIANDPGTRRGEDYEYDYEVLINAIHDFPGTKEDIEQGSKRVLYFEAEQLL
ncbi:MAG: C39 family peptidase [Candidatus Moranbacteria bacterium]|jgi:hypothetical protein|nr:C39 family peptidase [Candidatus Moranbacteria bacterium]